MTSTTITDIQLAEPIGAADIPSSTRPSANDGDIVPLAMEQLDLEEETNASGDESQYPSGVKFHATIAALLLSMAVTGLDGSIMTTAIPTITNHFRTIRDVAWYSAGLRLTMCSTLFLLSKMYTLLPIKPLYLVSLGIFELGCLICTIAWTSPILVLGRSISGLGMAGIISGVFTIITNAVPLRRRALIGGLCGAVETLAGVTGPLIGGVLTTKVSWRACPGINIPLGVVSMLIILFTYTEPTRADAAANIALPWKQKLLRLDLPSTAIFLPAMTCLLLAIQWGGSMYSWQDPRILALFAIFAVLVSVFIYLQYRNDEAATLPPRIVKQRSIALGALFCGLCNGVLSVVEYYTVIYFQAVLGYSAAKSGILQLPQIIGLTVSCMIAGTGTTAIGYYVPFMLLAAIISPIASGLLTTIDTHVKLASVLGFTGMLGFGMGIGMQGPQVAAQTVLKLSDVPLGIGVVMFGQSVGPMTLLPVAQAIFLSRLQPELARAVAGSGGAYDVAGIESLGLSDLRHLLDGNVLRQTLLGYDDAAATVMYLPLGLSLLSLLCAAGMEWKSVKAKQQ